MRVRPFLLLGLAAGACHGSSSSHDQTLLAAATIGPEGGVLAVDSGRQAGLRLTVPPGALLAPTEIRVRDTFGSPAIGALPTSIVEPPGDPFRLEPEGLRLEERATLRAPYRPYRLVGTSPGNVRAREMRNGFPIDYDPDVVDITSGYVEVPIRYLSEYLVVAGPAAAGIASYVPQQPGAAVELANGHTFTVEEVPPTSPFPSTPSSFRWRITGPSQPLPQPVDLLYFSADHMLGRESVAENWREVWSAGVPFAAASGPVLPANASMTMPMSVAAPASQPGIGGQMTVYSVWSYAAPRRIAGQPLYDILQCRMALAWNRADLGVGQREYLFLFAPGIGLVGFAEDGVEHLRTTL